MTDNNVAYAECDIEVDHPFRPGDPVRLRFRGETVGWYPTREAAWAFADDILACEGEVGLRRRAWASPSRGSTTPAPPTRASV